MSRAAPRTAFIPVIANKRCRRLRKGGDLFSALNNSSDVPPRDPSAAARSFFLQRTHIVKPHPPSLPKRGVGMGVGWAYETLVTQGRPKQGQDTYSHLSEVAYSHHPIEDDAKSTWLDSKPEGGETPHGNGVPQPSYPSNPSGSPAEVYVYMVRSRLKHISTGINVGQMKKEVVAHLSNNNHVRNDWPFPQHIITQSSRLSGSQIISYMHGCMTTLTPSAGEMGRNE